MYLLTFLIIIILIIIINLIKYFIRELKKPRNERFKIKESYINTHIEYNQKIWPYAKLRDIILDKDRNVFKYRFINF